MVKDYSFTTEDGDSIDITLYAADQWGKQPCVIYVHGFKGFKDWGFVPYAGEQFAKAGISLLTFNFSHNGIGKNKLEFTEFDKFRINTFSREVAETLEIIDLCTKTSFFGAPLKQPLGIIGHSRGGGIAILAANQNPAIKAVTTWASVSTFDRREKKLKQSWKKKGYIEVSNKRTGQVFQLGKELLDDIERNAKGSLNILNAVKNLNRPLLIVHGQSDETVPFYDAEQINIYGDPLLSNIRLIPNTGHTFGVAHPFTESSNAFDLVLDLSGQFFLEKLNE